jgi:hypothetical protein
MENMAVIEPKDQCMEDLQYFLCKMYFPQCLFGQTLPLCWFRCIAAYDSCGIAEESAIETCQGYVDIGMVAPDGNVCSSASIAHPTVLGTAFAIAVSLFIFVVAP